MEKSKRVFITKLQLGLPWTPMQRQQKGASNSGFVYIGYSRAKNVTFCGRVRCWVLIGFHFLGWPWVLIGSHFLGLILISWAGHKS